MHNRKEGSRMELVELRRNLHQHPEVGFTEFRTASMVVEHLQSLGFDVQYGSEAMEAEFRKGVPSESEVELAYKRALKDGVDPEIIKKMKGGLTAVTGELKGSRPGPTIAFRFDMDALPILESEEDDHLPFKEGFRSEYEGNMHACAHDGHTAIGLKLAEELSGIDFAGTLMLVFQPAEEGGRGAASIAAKGILDKVDKLYCMHLGLDIPLGKVCGGTYGWLATTKIVGNFHGIPSHAGATPEKGRNALVGAATALLNIQGLPRYSGGKTRVNVGSLQGGTAPNIIPSEATMVMETRSEDADINNDLEKRVREIIKHSALMHDLGYEIETIGEATTIHCDESLVNTVLQEANKIDEFTTVEKMCQGSGSEDASILINRVQEKGGEGTYMIIGTTIPAAHHNQKFDIDEKALPMAVDLLNRVARHELQSNMSESS